MEKAFKNIIGSQVKHPFLRIKYIRYMFFELPRDLCTTFQSFKYSVWLFTRSAFSATSSFMIVQNTIWFPNGSKSIHVLVLSYITVRSFTVKGGVLRNINIKYHASIFSSTNVKGMRDKKKDSLSFLCSYVNAGAFSFFTKLKVCFAGLIIGLS